MLDKKKATSLQEPKNEIVWLCTVGGSVHVLRILALFFIVLFSFGVVQAAPATEPKKEPAKTDEKKNSEPDMSFVVVRASYSWCEPDCIQWISAEGKIETNTAEKFAQLLNDPKLRKLPVVVNSGGGSITSALAMGRLIRKYKMDTAVGRTNLTACTQDDREKGKCKADPVLKAHDGKATPYRAYCGSACPLMLLGGMHRVVDPASYIGLHQPTNTSRPYRDWYTIRYRMVKGKKEIISRTFVKRVYEKTKIEVGITPRIRENLIPYIKQMGGSPDILVEMSKAAPKDMNWISYASRDREKLGLVTANFRTLDTLVGVNLCGKKGVQPENCIHLKAKEVAVMRPFDRGA